MQRAANCSASFCERFLVWSMYKDDLRRQDGDTQWPSRPAISARKIQHLQRKYSAPCGDALGDFQVGDFQRASPSSARSAAESVNLSRYKCRSGSYHSFMSDSIAKPSMSREALTLTGAVGQFARLGWRYA